MPAALFQLGDLQIGHWLMVAGGELVILGAIGLLVSGGQNTAEPQANEPSTIPLDEVKKKISDGGEHQGSGQALPPVPSATNIRIFPQVLRDQVKATRD